MDEYTVPKPQTYPYAQHTFSLMLSPLTLEAVCQGQTPAQTLEHGRRGTGSTNRKGAGQPEGAGEQRLQYAKEKRALKAAYMAAKERH